MTVIDASVIMAAFFPDEAQPQAQALIRAYVSERAQLVAPTLLTYEVANGVLKALRGGRITEEQAHDILEAFENLNIPTEPVSWQSILPLARRFDCTAYDAAYLALSQARGEPLVTGDLRLCHAVEGHLQAVHWIGEEGLLNAQGVVS